MVKLMVKFLVKLLKITWVFLCILVLATTFRFSDPSDPIFRAETEIDIFLFLAMVMLSFPAGYGLALPLSAAACLHLQLYGGYRIDILEYYEPYYNYFYFFYMFSVWALFFFVGYLQWFKLVPWLIARFHSIKKGAD